MCTSFSPFESTKKLPCKDVCTKCKLEGTDCDTPEIRLPCDGQGAGHNPLTVTRTHTVSYERHVSLLASRNHPSADRTVPAKVDNRFAQRRGARVSATPPNTCRQFPANFPPVAGLCPQ
ncbi:hypothetical protein Bbelb_056730 [Branchiostoma belcheri]|nr:hypothetical protein Bbelb_056730 [Branchiostoma belcheri]